MPYNFLALIASTIPTQSSNHMCSTRIFQIYPGTVTAGTDEKITSGEYESWSQLSYSHDRASDILEALLLLYVMLYKILLHNNRIVERRRYIFRLITFVEGLGIPT